MLQKEVPWLKSEFFPATDGREHTIPEEEVAKSWNTKCNALYGQYEDIHDKDGNLIHSVKDFEDPGVMYDFSPGERGCAHSHYRMWKKTVEAGKPLLVLEDDVQLVFKRTGGGKANGKVFTERLNLGMSEAIKKNADVLYLGWAGFRDGNYKHHKAARGKKNPIIRKAEYVWTTVAYVIWPKGAQKLLDASKPLDQPVDNFMAWQCREGRLDSYILLDEGDQDGQWEGGIVAQLDFLGDSDIKKSDGGHQNDDPTAFLTAKANGEAQPPAQDPDGSQAPANEAAEEEAQAGEEATE